MNLQEKHKINITEFKSNDKILKFSEFTSPNQSTHSHA